jgi:ABC-type glycerol-3-phosphate transport system permease component
VPSTVTVDNYAGLVHSGFMQGVVNSVLVAAITILLGIVVCVPAAFALSVLNFPGRGAVFAALVVSFSVPFDILAIPLAQLVRDWGLSNTIIALVLPGVGNGFAIFLLRQFFLAIPVSLVEAARIDGASWWRVLWQVYVPMSRSVLVGAGLIIFTFQWQSYLWPLLAATSSDSQLAPTRLAALSSLYDANTGQVLAGAALLALIPAVVLLVFQRHFVRSTSTSGLNG